MCMLCVYVSVKTAPCYYLTGFYQAVIGLLSRLGLPGFQARCVVGVSLRLREVSLKDSGQKNPQLGSVGHLFPLICEMENGADFKHKET